MRPVLWPILWGAGQPFNLDTWLASVGGSRWDFTETDDQFQEATGPTPASTINNPIGLKLDRGLWRGRTLAQVVAGQPELLVPGTWLMSVNGGSGTATENPLGTLNLSGDGTNAATADQSFSTIAGCAYKLAAVNSGANDGSYAIGISKGGSTVGSGAITSGSSLTTYFVATAATTWVRFFRMPTSGCVINSISCKLIPGYAASQSSASLKPTYQSTGSKYDGNDDNMLTGYTAGAGENFIAARVTVPASMATINWFVGANGAGVLAAGFNTTGKFVGAVGNDGGSKIKGTSDQRGADVCVGITVSGSIIQLFVDGAIEYSAPQSGSPSTTVPFRLGAFNNSGAATGLFGGSIKHVVAGRQFLDLPTYLKIRSALLAV